MKIGTILRNGKKCLAVAGADGAVMDISNVLAGLVPAGTVPDIEWAIAGQAEAHNLIECASRSGEVLDAADVKWLPPVPHPGKVLCLALNNSANVERIISGPKHPAFFSKPQTSLTGHQEPIMLRPQYGRVHPEPELCVVMGRGGRDIKARNAYEYVFGYTVMNDLTSPTMRTEDSFHYRAIHPSKTNSDVIEYVDTHVTYPGRYKGSDTFGPIGPWIATRDDIPDPHALTVSCHHKGTQITADETSNLFYKVPEVIEFISTYMTLEAGDLIAMGTALKRAGVGVQAVQNVDLNKLGGPVSVTISGIGTLSNPVGWL